jgi:hypothetical protein
MSKRDSFPMSLQHQEEGTDRAAALLGNAPQLLACVGAALLFLSMAYDFSYLYSLGLGFNDVPTTLADHVRSALVWAPTALVYLLVAALWEIACRRLRGRPVEEPIRPSRFHRLVQAAWKYISWMLLVVIGIAIAVDVVFSTSSRVLFFVALFGWGTLASWFVFHDRLGTRLSRSTKVLIVVAPVMSAWVGLLGYGHGRDTLDRRGPAWQVDIKLDSSSQRRLVKGLRRFTTSTILIGMDGKVDVIPPDTIVVATLLAGVSRQGRLCTWLRIGCEVVRGSAATHGPDGTEARIE